MKTYIIASFVLGICLQVETCSTSNNTKTQTDQSLKQNKINMEEIEGNINFLREDSTAIETGIGVHARIFKILRTDKNFDKIKSVLLEAQKKRKKIRLMVTENNIISAETLNQ